jgi:hypothetical protein
MGSIWEDFSKSRAKRPKIIKLSGALPESCRGQTVP